MNDENVLEDLISFIREGSGEFKMRITKETLIEDDLGVTGDDGVDLIKEYSEIFKVDISHFEYSKYFHPEPSFLISYGSVLPLTVGDLENAIKDGKLE